MSDLAAFLTQSGQTQKQFADRVGVDQGTVSRLIQRKMRPSLTLAVTIERETDGAIPAASWVPLSDQQQGAA